MSFFYLLSSPINNLPSLHPIYYAPPEYQPPPNNLLIINPTHPSQAELKQNFILSTNLTTRDSLQQENE